MQKSGFTGSSLELYDNCVEESATLPSLDFHGLSWQQLIQRRYQEEDTVSQSPSCASSLHSGGGLTWQRFLNRPHYNVDLHSCPSDCEGVLPGNSLPWQKTTKKQEKKQAPFLHYNTVAEGCRRKTPRVNLEALYEGPKLGESASNTCSDSNASVSTCENSNGSNGNFVIRRPSLFALRRNSTSTSSDSGCSGLSSGTTSSVLKDSSLLQMPIAVGAELWKDNPDHDQFYTFAVSEDEVTKVISYLENALSVQKLKSSLRNPDIPDRKNVSPKVTFILDTYCHMYMTRYVCRKLTFICKKSLDLETVN